ncbi:MAG: HD domain-containing protein [bacterium]|nr:HD domain-containing protein [bacterium]
MAKREWATPDNDVMIPFIIRNEDGIFSGSTLEPYLKALFKSTGVNNPYHDLRHSLHVMRSAYLAARYHSDELTPLQIRHIVIAGITHDLNHSGRAKPGYDSLEILRAVFALEKCVTEEDRQYLPEIGALISATQFPPAKKEGWSLSEMILQDADMTQTFGVAWVQQVAVGLAMEWDMTPFQILQNQKGFLSSLQWKTEWAKQSFPPRVVQARIDEAEMYVAMLS